jgi:hypothetical protein
MSSQAFELAILISLKDAASGGADRVSDRLRAMGKEGKVALKTFEDLRKDLRHGLVLSGVGAAGLSMLGGGIKKAGDFEAAMADLRMSLQELGTDGKLNLVKLNGEMNQAESLAMRCQGPHRILSRCLPCSSKADSMSKMCWRGPEKRSPVLQ